MHQLFNKRAPLLSISMMNFCKAEKSRLGTKNLDLDDTKINDFNIHYPKNPLQFKDGQCMIYKRKLCRITFIDNFSFSKEFFRATLSSLGSSALIYLIYR